MSVTESASNQIKISISFDFISQEGETKIYCIWRGELFGQVREPTKGTYHTSCSDGRHH